MNDSEISSRISAVRENIARICEQIKKDPSTITICAVSKKHSFESIFLAYRSGIVHFGENYIQELMSKINEGKKYQNETNIHWHFIGHLQTNKVKYIPSGVMIQSVHSASLAMALSKHARDKKIDIPILLQVKLDDNEKRNGISVDQVFELVKSCRFFPGILLKGLMCILPKEVSDSENNDLILKHYKKVNEIFLEIREKYFQHDQFNILSMGMSHDYHLAIQAGANLIRVGTAIFGERHYGA